MMRRLTAWLQLLRLPNVFTAAADVTMGFLVTNPLGNLEPNLHFGMLVVSSCLLYLSGMALNDVFDAEVDAREQPGRPIPSGRVSLSAAKVAGWALWTAGVCVAWSLSWIANDWRPGTVASFLAACIVMYDYNLKRSRFAPLIMGECRFLNVLLGMSLMILPWGKFELLLAAGIGVYVVGVTMFARTDARTSARSRLMAGFAVLVGGMALLAGTPWLTFFRPQLEIPLEGWYILWVALTLITARRCLMAIFEPTSPRVQAAVRHCVLSIIVLDAAVCVGYVGPYWGFVVLALLFPSMLLALWLKAT